MTDTTPSTTEDPQPLPLTEDLILASLEAARAARRAAFEAGMHATAVQADAVLAFNPTTIADTAGAAVEAAMASLKARAAATLAECGALNKENWTLRSMAEALLAGTVSEDGKEAFKAYLAPGGRM